MNLITPLKRCILPLTMLLAAACEKNPLEELGPPTIVLTAPTRTVVAGSTLPVSASVTEANGSASTRQVQWQSSDPSVATVNGFGMVSGVGGGTATITASVGGASSTIDIVVMRAPNAGGPQSTFLSYASALGDYIGQGQSARYGINNGTWAAAASDGGNRVSIRYDGGGATWWDVDLAAPQGQALRVGTYENATRYPFQAATSPGLSFSGSGRGCNTLTGRFVIHDIAIDHEGKLHRLHATFRQHCEGGASYLDGEVAVLHQPLR